MAARRFVVAVLLLASAPSGGSQKGQNADVVIYNYLREVQKTIGKDPRALGQEGILRKFHELGQKHLLKNKEVLHRKASKDYLRLDELTFIKPDGKKRIVWRTVDEFRGKHGEIIVPPPADQAGQFLSMFMEEGYGIPPFDRHAIATTWWDPVVAARTIRELAFRQRLGREESDKRQFLEQFAAPRLYRLSDDPNKPSVAFLDGRELFVADLEYTEIGIYALRGLRWVKLE